MAAIRVRELIGFCPGSRFEASLNQLLDHTPAGGSPHVADIQILAAITVIIEPRRAHPRPDIFDSRRVSHVVKPATLVLVQILAAKIVGHVKVGPTVAIVVTPRRSETVAIVVFV